MLARILLLSAASLFVAVGGAVGQPAPDMTGITFDATYLPPPQGPDFVGALRFQASVDLAKRGEFTAFRYKCQFESPGIAIEDQIDRNKFSPSVAPIVRADVEFSMRGLPVSGRFQCMFLRLIK
jgi:hypothetical protein